jgi:acetoin:2,6-dichlorophenolindophenol oxidoreductase subunit beta
VRTLSYSRAIAEAMAEEMRRDPMVILWGLDVGAFGGAFGVTQGLYDEFGPDRVIDMPISEAGFVGCGVGAAATGIRPVIEVMFCDWMTIASDQLVNQAATMRYMFGGKVQMPLVIRTTMGGYLSAAAQHSKCVESVFSFFPGFKVVTPGTPYDAKGLLKAAIRDNNPVIFFEHKRLYEIKGPVPEEEYTIPLGKAEVKRTGKDVTIVTYAYMVGKSLAAAETLAKEGIEVEVLDLRTVDPLDEEAILTSLRRTHRLVIVQEAWRQCSISSEVAALVSEKGFDYLDAPILRVTAEDVPCPFSPVLEQRVLPGEDDIVRTVRRVLS